MSDMRLYLISMFCLVLLSCSSEEEPLLQDYPVTFEFAQANSTGMRTYYYTDTIIYRVDNLQDLDTLSLSLDREVRELLLERGPDSNEFIMTEITFEDELVASISYYVPGIDSVVTDTSLYFLNQNIGIIRSPFEFTFRLNEDLSNLLSCVSHIATRKIDTLFLEQDSLLMGIDTFEVDTQRFQLIPTDSSFVRRFCNPINESIEIELYANDSSIVNNDRIIIHRMDLEFQPK